MTLFGQANLSTRASDGLFGPSFLRVIFPKPYSTRVLGRVRDGIGRDFCVMAI